MKKKKKKETKTNNKLHDDRPDQSSCFDNVQSPFKTTTDKLIDFLLDRKWCEKFVDKIAEGFSLRQTLIKIGSESLMFEHLSDQTMV